MVKFLRVTLAGLIDWSVTWTWTGFMFPAVENGSTESTMLVWSRQMMRRGTIQTSKKMKRNLKRMIEGPKENERKMKRRGV